MAETETLSTSPPVTQSAIETVPVTETSTSPEISAPVPSVLTEALNKPVETVESVEPAQNTPDPVVAEEIKPQEVKTDQVENKTQEGQSEEPAPPPAYDPFTFPEGVQIDEERVKEFTGLLAELEMANKVDHAVVQQFGQKAVDFHLAELQRTVNELQKFYTDSWEKQKVTWKEDFLKDPEIGGNRMQTTVDSALTFIRTHGGTPEQQAELRAIFDNSGLGNHKALIRLFANAGRGMSEGKPLAALAPVPQSKSILEKMYGKKPG